MLPGYILYALHTAIACMFILCTQAAAVVCTSSYTLQRTEVQKMSSILLYSRPIHSTQAVVLDGASCGQIVLTTRECDGSARSICARRRRILASSRLADNAMTRDRIT